MSKLEVRTDPQLELALRLLHAKLQLNRSALVRLALLRLVELEGLPRPDVDEPPPAESHTSP